MKHNKKEKFEHLLTEVKKIQRKRREPLTFNEFIKIFNKIIFSKETPSNINKAVKSIIVDNEIISLIELFIIQNKNDPWITQHLFMTLIKTKSKISDKTLRSLCKNALSQELDPHPIHHLCLYIVSLNNQKYCEFFKKIIEKFVEEKNYLAGDVASIAATLKCTNCCNSIKKILESEDKNPRALILAKEALKKLSKEKNVKQKNN